MERVTPALFNNVMDARLNCIIIRIATQGLSSCYKVPRSIAECLCTRISRAELRQTSATTFRKRNKPILE